MEICKDPERIGRPRWIAEFYEDLTGVDIIDAVREDIKRVINKPAETIK